MSSLRAEVHTPFEGGPPQRFQTWIGLIKAGKPQNVQRALLASGIAWVPLALLSALHGDFYRSDHANALSMDFGTYARFLLAPALLVLAESVGIPRLAAIVRQFVKSGLVADADRDLYERAVSSTQRLMKARSAEIGAVVLPYVLIVGLLVAEPPSSAVPAWHGELRGNVFHFWPAGWWALLVSTPMLLMLLLGWLWRLILWSRFLWLMSQIELQLVPAHPDRCGGLRFVGTSLESFMPLAFTFGVIAAGAMANRVVHFGASPTDFKALAVGVLLFAIVIFTGPLFVFAPRLLREQHRGMFRYGAIAQGLGQQFERKWLSLRQVDKGALEVPDFSATVDLYAVVGGVYTMRILPLELRYVLLLGIMTLLPFVPVALLTVPVSVLIKEIAELVL